MICDGYLPRLASYRWTVKSSSQHWLLPKTVAIPGKLKEYVSEYHSENDWLHHCEFCPGCAVVVEIDNDVKLVTAKELYNL